MPSYSFAPDGGRAPEGGAQDAGMLRAELRRLGLPEAGLAVGIRDGVVSLSGQVPDAATRERIVLALGNLQGVARVEDGLETVEQPPLAASLSAFARLPPGAASADMAEEMVHEARPGATPVLGPAGSLFVAAGPDDSLPAIARRHYGDETAWPRILEANRDALPSERELTPGLTLRLPQG